MTGATTANSSSGGGEGVNGGVPTLTTPTLTPTTLRNIEQIFAGQLLLKYELIALYLATKLGYYRLTKILVTSYRRQRDILKGRTCKLNLIRGRLGRVSFLLQPSTY